ncbi:unnamed protein product [uncultured bacterium]|nr:unnamed protein product [uncultured bacterium]
MSHSVRPLVFLGLFVAAVSVPVKGQEKNETLTTCGSHSTDPAANAEEPWCLAGEDVVGYAADSPPRPTTVVRDNPPCLASFDPQFRQGLDAAREAAAASKYPLVVAGVELANYLISNKLIGGTPGDWLGGIDGRNQSNCLGMVVSVPPGRQITRIQMTVAGDNTIPGGCRILRVTNGQVMNPDEPYRCGAYVTWWNANRPGTDSSQALAFCAWYKVRIDGRIVSAVFANWSTGQTRTAYLRAYYR